MGSVDRSKVWAGSLNDAAGATRSFKAPGFYDTTLRDGEQSVGAAFDPEQKLEMAILLDKLGVGRIEAGFPKVSEEDRAAIRKIQAAKLSAEIWGFSRALVDDVAAVAELDMRHVVIEAPVSSMKLSALNVSPEAVTERVAKAVKFAADSRLQVAFFGVDSSRAELGFLERVYKTARDAGASEFVVVDTLGIATPEAVGYFIGKVRGWFGKDVPIHFHGHNDFGLATACAVAAARAGADWIHGTVDGIGERAGNANLPEIAAAFELLYQVGTGIDLKRVRATSERLREIAGYQLEPWKSVVGRNLFVRETGAVAAQFHVPQAIEPYAASLLDTPRGIVLGKKSGLASIRIKCEELGLKAPQESYAQLLEEVKQAALRKRGLLTDDEFRQLVARVA